MLYVVSKGRLPLPVCIVAIPYLDRIKPTNVAIIEERRKENENKTSLLDQNK
jgi:hypothetical protein